MIYFLIKTLITAIVVVIVAEIAKRSSLLAGLIVSIPLTTFLAMVWLYWETKDTQKIINKIIGCPKDVTNTYISPQNKFNNLKIENNYANLLKNKKIKNFFLATPPSKNFKIAKKALLYNKNVFVEKPLVFKMQEAKKLLAEAKKRKLFLIVFY